MKIPSRKKCYRLIREMEMMEHIVAHSIQVCRVAVMLVDHLRAGGLDLNSNLVEASALLHDITKTRSFRTGETHSETGCHFLVDQGYPEVGNVVRQHVRLDAYFESKTVSEAEVVNYADKRVLHDKIVTLSQRMNYIMERYGTTPEIQQKLRWLWEKSLEQERRIFADLSFSPEQVEGNLNREDLAQLVCRILTPDE